jgi:hypothetical protein
MRHRVQNILIESEMKSRDFNLKFEAFRGSIPSQQVSIITLVTLLLSTEHTSITLSPQQLNSKTTSMFGISRQCSEIPYETLPIETEKATYANRYPTLPAKDLSKLQLGT